MPFKNTEDKKKFQKGYQWKWIAARRKKWFDSNGPCIDCGSNDRLELDHLDSKTKISHRIWSWSRIEQEVKKCVVRCFDCHMKHTIQQIREVNCTGVTHGTVSGYMYWKCRCEECKAARKIERRKWYLNYKARVSQLAEDPDLKSVQCEFESHHGHHLGEHEL